MNKCEKYEGLINRYRDFLPVNDSTPVVTLNEGNTPLIKANNLAKKGYNSYQILKYFYANTKYARINPEYYK